MVTSPLRETVVEPSRELDDRIVAHSLILCMRGHVGAAAPRGVIEMGRSRPAPQPAPARAAILMATIESLPQPYEVLGLVVRGPGGNCRHRPDRSDPGPAGRRGCGHGS